MSLRSSTGICSMIMQFPMWDISNEYFSVNCYSNFIAAGWNNSRAARKSLIVFTLKTWGYITFIFKYKNIQQARITSTVFIKLRRRRASAVSIIDFLIDRQLVKVRARPSRRWLGVKSTCTLLLFYQFHCFWCERSTAVAWLRKSWERLTSASAILHYPSFSCTKKCW